VIPVAFDYERATSAAKLLAGGHSLLPLMKYRLAAPAVVVDIGRLSDLSYVRDDGDVVAIGALTRHRDVEVSDLVRSQAGLLSAATCKVGDPQVDLFRRRRSAGD
jgi:carbon-monoxide dehydrogenase medium subunit